MDHMLLLQWVMGKTVCLLCVLELEHQTQFLCHHLLVFILHTGVLKSWAFSWLFASRAACFQTAFWLFFMIFPTRNWPWKPSGSSACHGKLVSFGRHDAGSVLWLSTSVPALCHWWGEGVCALICLQQCCAKLCHSSGRLKQHCYPHCC